MVFARTDQIALSLRAADELRVLNAKSMSEVFRSIVSHLSTPYKEDLSYDSMRSKAYVADEIEGGSSVYVATNAMIQGFSETLRKEVPLGIKLSLIEPG